jgi:hypothetical protein
MTGEVTILYGEWVGTPDDGGYVPTVAQIGVRENCEVITVLLLPACKVMDARAAGIPVADLLFETCLN